MDWPICCFGTESGIDGQLRGLMGATGRSRWGLFVAAIAACGLCAEAALPAAQEVPLPRPRPSVPAGKQAGGLK